MGIAALVGRAEKRYLTWNETRVFFVSWLEICLFACSIGEDMGENVAVGKGGLVRKSFLRGLILGGGGAVESEFASYSSRDHRQWLELLHNAIETPAKQSFPALSLVKFSRDALMRYRWPIIRYDNLFESVVCGKREREKMLRYLFWRGSFWLPPNLLRTEKEKSWPFFISHICSTHRACRLYLT